MLLGMTAPGGGRKQTKPQVTLIVMHAIGGMLGGLLVGALLAAGAIVLDELSLTERAAILLGVSATVAAADLGAFSLPSWKRQVPSSWATRFGRRLAFLVYGIVLGSGVTTFIPWGAMYVTFASAILLGSFKLSILVGGVFGLARALTSGVGSFKPTPSSLLLYRSFRSRGTARSISVAVAAMGAAIATSLITAHSVAQGGTGMTSIASTQVSYDGLRLTAPAGWSGRVLYLDYRGTSFMIQAANFVLPPQEGFAPPPELPAGTEDRIASMTGGDVLISVIPAGITGDSGASRSIRRQNLETSGRVMKGMSMATARRQVAGRLLDIEVTFGSSSPSDEAIGTANAVIDSVSGA